MEKKKRITILLPRNKPPGVHDLIASVIDISLKKLKQKYDIKLVWVVFQPEIMTKIKNNDLETIDFHDYHDAIKILEQTKPDLIFVDGSLDFFNVAFTLAGKFKKIPTVTWFFRWSYDTTSITRWMSIRSRLRILSSSKIAADHSGGKNSKWRTISFFIKKYLFLINTIKVMNYNILQLIQFTGSYTKLMMLNLHPVDKKFSGDLNLCLNKHWITLLQKNNFSENSIALVGSPYFDEVYEKIKSFPSTNSSQKQKIKILFCPGPIHEHGYISKTKEDKLVIKVINEILNDGNFEIDMKIHPSTSSFEEYSKLLNNVKYNVKLFQKEDLLELLKNYDMMLTYGNSSVALFGIAIKKPVVFINFFTDGSKPQKNTYHYENITVECNRIESLLSKIKKVKQSIISENDFEKYMNEYLGMFDGKSSERIANHLLKILEKK